jgi:hypothetical protein
MMEYVAGELDKATAEEIRMHIDACDECKKEYELALGMSEAIENAAFDAPAELHGEIMTAIRNEKKRQRRARLIRTLTAIGASAAALLNALKVLGGVDDSIDLISSTVIKPIQELKVNHMGSTNPRLHTDEILLSLAVSAATDPTAKVALDQLSKLKGAQLHSSVILSAVDEMTLKKLGINVTCEPKRQSSSAYAKN